MIEHLTFLKSYRQALRRLQNGLLGGSFSLFAGLMVANMVAYVYHMLLARMMSPADYGVVVTLTAISYVLTVFMRTFQAWMIKAVSAASNGGAGGMRALFIFALRRLVPLGGVAFAAHWLASHWVADFLHLGAATPVIVLGLYTFTSFLTPIPRGVLLGLNRLHAAGVVSVLDPVARLGAGIVLVGWGLKVNGALTGYALGNVLAFTAALVALWPLLRRNGGQELPVGSFDGLNRYAVSVLVINLSLMVMASVDQVAVKHFFSEEVAGNYAVAFLLGRVIGMSTIALSWVIFARATTMVPDDPRRVRLLAKGLFVIGAIAVTFTAGFNAAPTLAVRMLGGSQYLIADAYVGLVGIEMTLFALVYVQAYYHISTGETRILWPLCFALLLEIALLARYHATVEQILLTLILVMSGLLLLVSAVSWWVLSDGANRLSKTE